MEHIGWSLVDQSGTEVAHWGDDKGVLQGIPNPLILPNGDQVCGLADDTDLGDYSLVKRFLIDEPPSALHKQTARVARFVYNATVVTVEYEAVASTVPQTVTPRQARLALLQANKLGAVKQAINSLDEATQITWEYATEINRADPLINQLGGALGMSQTDIDNLFKVAVTL